MLVKRNSVPASALALDTFDGTFTLTFPAQPLTRVRVLGVQFTNQILPITGLSVRGLQRSRMLVVAPVGRSVQGVWRYSQVNLGSPPVVCWQFDYLTDEMDVPLPPNTPLTVRLFPPTPLSTGPSGSIGTTPRLYPTGILTGNGASMLIEVELP